LDGPGDDEAETLARATVGFSEIDYERRKATGLPAGPMAPLTAEHIEAVNAFERQAQSRGIRFATFRRIAEAISGGTVRTADLRTCLLRNRPERSAWPLWRVSD